jgi:hypothetical protein
MLTLPNNALFWVPDLLGYKPHMLLVLTGLIAGFSFAMTDSWPVLMSAMSEHRTLTYPDTKGIQIKPMQLSGIITHYQLNRLEF